uniref:Resolvase n=2 Tax=Methylophaga nitratireducenticrescens TaxID=754476 RepID=I1XGM7_METNJ
MNRLIESDVPTVVKNYEQHIKNRKTLQGQLAQLDMKIEQYMNRLMESDAPSVVKNYEQHIKKLEENKVEIMENIQKNSAPKRELDDILRTTVEFFENVSNLWKNGRFEEKRAVLKLAFSGKLA